MGAGPEAIKLFTLTSTEHEILSAHNNKIAENKDFSCFKTLRGCILPANKC